MLHLNLAMYILTQDELRDLMFLNVDAAGAAKDKLAFTQVEIPLIQKFHKSLNLLQISVTEIYLNLITDLFFHFISF